MTRQAGNEGRSVSFLRTVARRGLVFEEWGGRRGYDRFLGLAGPLSPFYRLSRAGRPGGAWEAHEFSTDGPNKVDRGVGLATLVLLAVLRSGAQRKSTLQPVVNENQSF